MALSYYCTPCDMEHEAGERCDYWDAPTNCEECGALLMGPHEGDLWCPRCSDASREEGRG